MIAKKASSLNMPQNSMVLFAIILACFCFGASEPIREENKKIANDKLTEFALQKTSGDEARIKKWMSEDEKDNLVLCAYNEDLKRNSYHSVAKSILIWSIPAYIVGLGLTMGCGDTPNPEHFCKETSTQIGTGFLGFGGMFGIIYGIYGIIHYKHPGPKTKGMIRDFHYWEGKN